MGVVSSWGLNIIRASRSDPPGRAASDRTRRQTYGAALQQFDELLAAATTAGHASRPLPLFYALSQAGRAIVAAYGASGTVSAHGLSEDRSAASTNPLARKVKRSRTRNDALTAVCGALNCADPFGSSATKIELGAAWAALPEQHVFLPAWKPRWRPALRAFNQGVEYGAGHDRTMELHVSTAAPRRVFDQRLYPAIPMGATFERTPAAQREIFVVPEFRVGTIGWPQALSTKTPFDITYCASGTRDRWLLPAAPGSDQPFTPLTAWCVLLFGLSIFARYNPGLWITTLNLDRAAGLALPLQLLLDRALEVVPQVIADALVTGSAGGGP
jgi:hypothetical protein